MRQAIPTQWHKTSTLRRSGSFGFGRSGASLRLRQPFGRSAGRRRGYPQILTQCAICSLLCPSCCLALLASGRPCQKPCARPCTFPSGMSLPSRYRGSHRPFAPQRRQRPIVRTATPLVRTEPRNRCATRCVSISVQFRPRSRRSLEFNIISACYIVDPTQLPAKQQYNTGYIKFVAGVMVDLVLVYIRA